MRKWGFLAVRAIAYGLISVRSDDLPASPKKDRAQRPGQSNREVCTFTRVQKSGFKPSGGS